MFNLSFFKTCVKCGEEKLISEFYAHPSNGDKLDCLCKECRKEKSRAWRASNRERHRAYSREHQARNKDVRYEYGKQWKKDNAERNKEYLRKWKIKNPERSREIGAAYTSRRRARIIAVGGSFTAKEWRDLKEKYGNKCLACGRTEPEVKITPDHVIPLALGGDNSIENIQPLCWGCNAAKQARIIDYRCQS